MKEILKEEAIEIFKKDYSASFFYKPKNKKTILKIKIRKIILKNKKKYQIETIKNNQAFHKNLSKKEMLKKINLFIDEFKHIEINTQTSKITLLQNKKGKIRILETENILTQDNNLQHNKEKNYILPLNPIPEFLKNLNLFTQDGKIIKNKYNKFKQINKYLEFIESIFIKLKELKNSKEKLQIVDFGCGKAYLSFALYYYLNEIKKIPTEIYGLDLKSEVIKFCNNLSNECNFKNLKFIQGDINNFNFSFQPDMIISLHACNTATDMALAKAIKINTPIIFAVPCCQHEINQQIRKNIEKIKKTNNSVKSLFDYGIITEKFSTLLTDTIRAKFLEKNGYKVNVEEFIDLEHTPKNILIKAIKKDKNIEKASKEIEILKKEFFLNLSIENFLK